jgi:hypothetical protein
MRSCVSVCIVVGTESSENASPGLHVNLSYHLECLGNRPGNEED